jgi:hypothetical protein
MGIYFSGTGAQARAFVSPWRKLQCCCVLETDRRAPAAQLCDPAERYPRSVTLSRIIFLQSSMPLARR